LWPLFGAVNQTLAALALIIITLYLRKKGGWKWIVSGIPAVFMSVVTLWASVINQMNFLESKNYLLSARYNGLLEMDDLRTVEYGDEGGKVDVVIGRTAEMRIVDKNTSITLTTNGIPYVKVGVLNCEWDPFNALIVSEASGSVKFENLIEGITYREESDEQTGYKEKVITETKDKTKNPEIIIIGKDKEPIKIYNLPVGSHVSVSEGEKVAAGQTLVKIPRSMSKSGDITGGLPRVTELFEARNPSNPAVVAEIDGTVSYGKIKRGNREIMITSRTGEIKKYLVSLSKQILVQPNDFVRAGIPLSDGAITPADILSIKGPTAVQEYIVNEVQEVYRMQGVKINDKHFEVIVRQMMRKLVIEDPGDTKFLEKQIIDKLEVMAENDWIYGKKVILDPGDSQNFKSGQIVSARKLRDENSMLKRRDLKPTESREAVPATSSQILQGITKASLQTKSWLSAASFQETTKVLNEAAILGKVDNLDGLKENVIVGHLIPAGTGNRAFEKVIVGSMDEYNSLMQAKDSEAESSTDEK